MLFTDEGVSLSMVVIAKERLFLHCSKMVCRALRVILSRFASVLR
jgi:hypothetical protein